MNEMVTEPRRNLLHYIRNYARVYATKPHKSPCSLVCNYVQHEIPISNMSRYVKGALHIARDAALDCVNGKVFFRSFEHKKSCEEVYIISLRSSPCQYSVRLSVYVKNNSITIRIDHAKHIISDQAELKKKIENAIDMDRVIVRNYLYRVYPFTDSENFKFDVIIFILDALQQNNADVFVQLTDASKNKYKIVWKHKCVISLEYYGGFITVTNIKKCK